MAWKIEFSEVAKTNWPKLDRLIAKRITSFLDDRVANLENPRTLATQLVVSAFDEVWRYRVGDYRVLARMFEDRILIVVTDLGHRREVYRQ